MVQRYFGNKASDRGVDVWSGLNNQGSDLWLLEPAGYCTKRDAGRRSPAYYIVNVKTGLVLTQTSTSDTGVVVWGRTPDDPVHHKRQTWCFKRLAGQVHVGQFVNYSTGNGLTQQNYGVDPSLNIVQTWPGQDGIKGRTWHLEPAPKLELAKITIKSVRAVQTSKGTDGATDALFKSIEFAAEYASGVGSGGAGTAASAGKSVAKMALKAGKKSADKAGQRRN